MVGKILTLSDMSFARHFVWKADPIARWSCSFNSSYFKCFGDMSL